MTGKGAEASAAFGLKKCCVCPTDPILSIESTVKMANEIGLALRRIALRKGINRSTLFKKRGDRDLSLLPSFFTACNVVCKVAAGLIDAGIVPGLVDLVHQGFVARGETVVVNPRT